MEKTIYDIPILCTEGVFSIGSRDDIYNKTFLFRVAARIEINEESGSPEAGDYEPASTYVVMLSCGINMNGRDVDVDCYYFIEEMETFLANNVDEVLNIW